MTQAKDTLKLFLIRRIEGGWDENIAHVIVATDRTEARRYAAKAARDEGEGAWWDDQRSTITFIGSPAKDLDAGIVLTEGC